MTEDMNYQHVRLAGVYDLDNPWGQDNDFYFGLAGPVISRVLDLGCGTGTLCCALAQRGHQVTGVDPASPMLAIASRQTSRRKSGMDPLPGTGLSFGPSLRPDRDDGPRLPNTANGSRSVGSVSHDVPASETWR